MKKKLPDIFDSVLKNSSVLISGPPRTGKSIFALQILLDALEKDEGVICILTNTFPEDFLKRIEIPKEKARLIKFIDCYTLYAGIPGKESSMIYRINGPVALNEMMVKVSKSISDLTKKTKKIRMIVYSLSTLMIYNKLERITRFLQMTIGKVKASNGISFFIMEEGVHDPKYVMAIAALTDVTLKLEKKDGKNYIKVIKVSEIKKPIRYKIVDSKIIIEE